MRQDALDFEEVRTIRSRVRALLNDPVRTLDVYRAENYGYIHLFKTASDGTSGHSGEPSKASTATCLASLIARGQPLTVAGDTAELLKWLFTAIDEGSAGLKPKNPFTTAFMLEAALTTARAAQSPLTPDQESKKQTAITRLEAIILHDRRDGPLAPELGGEAQGADNSKHVESRAERGAANIEPYPPTAFLTQLVIRCLRQAGSVSKVEQAARDWARHSIEHELALLVGKDELADAFALAYSVMTFASLSLKSHLTPQERRLLTLALDRVFAAQHEDGSWPRSRPLFHYEKVGNAYCFEYEMLTQLLLCTPLQDDVDRHVKGLLRAVGHIEKTRYDLVLPNAGTGSAWASGHHPQIRGPESWSTASVYHYLHLLERLLSRVIKRDLFTRLKSEMPRVMVQRLEVADFGKHMLDAKLFLDGEDLSLKAAIRDRFVVPLANAREKVENGGRFGDEVKMSMLLFGPPGTSKTSLAKEIAKVLAWPLLEVDPSHILLEGWDRVHATAIRLFDELAELDSAVVLLDEFDELVRTRTDDQGEPISRFFTTAMLPKLIKLNKERRIVLLMATNFVDQFDDAIKREGRFDAVVQLMPPTAEEKMRRWPSIDALKNFSGLEFRGALEHFTYLEAERLAEALKGVTTLEVARETFDEYCRRCNMVQERGDKQDWRAVSRAQRRHIRLPM